MRRFALVCSRLSVVPMICILLFSSICPAFAMTDWLVLFYINGNNDRGLSGEALELINRLEKQGSTDNVTIVAKYSFLEKDAEGGLQFPREAQTILVQSDNGDPEITSLVLDSSPMIDMADRLSLSLFIRKNLTRYPAKMVMLVLWGKGEGTKGLLHDDISQNHMSVMTLAKTLNKVREKSGKKIDFPLASHRLPHGLAEKR